MFDDEEGMDNFLARVSSYGGPGLHLSWKMIRDELYMLN